MPTAITITIPPNEWSKDKRRMLKRDILLWIAQEGAPNAQWAEREVDKKGVPVGGLEKRSDRAQEALIKLKCKSCQKEPWYSTRFTECPTCGSRTGVVKAQVKKEVPPKGAIVI